MFIPAWNPRQTAGSASGLHLDVTPASGTITISDSEDDAAGTPSLVDVSVTITISDSEDGSAGTPSLVVPPVVCARLTPDKAPSLTVPTVCVRSPQAQRRASRQSFSSEGPASPQAKCRRSPPPPRRASTSSKGKNRASSAPSIPVLMNQCRGLPTKSLMTAGTYPESTVSKRWDESKMHELVSTLCKKDETSSVPSTVIIVSKTSEEQATAQRYRSVYRGRTDHP